MSPIGVKKTERVNTLVPLPEETTLLREFDFAHYQT